MMRRLLSTIGYGTGFFLFGAGVGRLSRVIVVRRNRRRVHA